MILSKEARDHFISNAGDYIRLISEKLPPGLNEEEVLEAMRDRAEKCRMIMAKNNAFLDRFFKEIEDQSLTREDSDELYDFAWRLHSVPCFDDEGKSVDQFLARVIYARLAEKAREDGWREREIQCRYILGEIYHYMTGISFSADAIACMRRVLELSEDYLAITDKRARYFSAAAYKALSACLYNSGAYRELFTVTGQGILFYGKEEVRRKDPDFPWDEFESKVRKLLTWVGPHIEFGVHGQGVDADIAKRSYQILAGGFTDGEIALLNGADPEKRLEYLRPETKKEKREHGIQLVSYAILAYHTGLINLDQYLDLLRDCLKAQIEWDGGGDFLIINNRINSVVSSCAILARYLGADQQANKEELADLASFFFRFLRGFPQADLDIIDAMSEELCCIMDNTPSVQDRRNYIDIILKSTTHNHLPTYVHSIMVARLITLMTRYFLEKDPAKLINLCGTKTAGEVLERREEILEEAELAGLAHDIGKISYIPVVSVTSRKLTDGEFDLIKRHPAKGHNLLNKEEYRCIADVVQGHHKFHRGNGGYPAEFDNTLSPFRFMIDLCSVADAIDAATDNIGRSYQICRSPDSIMDQIISMAGDRYNPDIAEALKDPGLRGLIRDTLENYRRQAYHRAYIELETG
ncbi:MAG: HD domain-containing protein [Treponema sp.]|nr:HD domain-containing protein [Treponema sp.]